MPLVTVMKTYVGLCLFKISFHYPEALDKTNMPSSIFFIQLKL